MSVKLAYNRVEQFSNGTGVPYSGAKLFTYVGGSVNTKQTTYVESTGTTPNTNPIVLDSSGQLPQPIWLTTGLSYKFVLAPSTDTDPPASPIWMLDGVTGVNDSSASQSEWIAGPTPTFVSATQFTLVGDQTTNFAKSRRVKATVTAGTVFGDITASTFGALTTVTVALDSGNLDSGLSAISYGIVAAVNPSINADLVNRKGTAVASAATTDIWSIAGDYVHVTGAGGPITSFGTAPYAGAQRTLIFDSTPTITQNAVSLILPSGANIVAAAGDRAVVRADTTANMIVLDFIRANGSAIAPFIDTNAVVKGSGDATKLVRFEVDGLTTGTTRTVTVPDADLTLMRTFTSAQQAITAAGSLTIAHGLGVSPTNLAAILHNTTAEFGYSIGDEVFVNVGMHDFANSRGLSVVRDSTNLNVRFGSTASSLTVLHKTTGVGNAITNANWTIIFLAFA